MQSSRRLEREAQRNVELIWLTGRLMPDFKTIADFRRDNGEAIRTACREFVLLCRALGLFEEATVAIDGSKFKAVNNRDKNFTERKLKARLQQLDESVERYLTELDRADRDPSLVTEARVEHLKDKLANVKAQMNRLRQIEQQLNDAPDQQVSLTDPDARSMATSGRGTGIVGYNVQAAVDTKHHLIVTHEVTNVGHDRTQLADDGDADAEHASVSRSRRSRTAATSMAKRSCAVSRWDRPASAEAADSNNKRRGLFDKSDFVYDETDDRYRCPAGERAIHRMTVVENGLTIAQVLVLGLSAMSAQAAVHHRQIAADRALGARGVLERMQRVWISAAGGTGTTADGRTHVRHAQTWMGATHFLTRTLPKVRTEMSLQVLAYNMKRVIQILGVQPLIAAIKAT